MGKSDRPYLLPADAADDLESAMRDFIGQRELELYRYMEYQLGWIDDAGGPDSGYGTVPRRHGMMCLHVAAAIGAPYELAIRYAVSLELVQAFATIHGDVQDSNSDRLGRPTVWWKWGPSQAINTGDGLHALARLSIFELVERGEPIDRVTEALEIVDNAVLKMCEGEFMDVQLQEKLPVSVDEYFAMATLRIGSLYGGAATLPSVLLTTDDGNPIASDLRTFGECVGVARQGELERRAMFNVKQRDPIEQGRIVAKKKSLPIALMFSAIDDATTRRKVGEVYMQRLLDPAHVDSVSEIAVQLGVEESARDLINSTFARAQESLDAAITSSDAKSALLAYARELVWGSTSGQNIT